MRAEAGVDDLADAVALGAGRQPGPGGQHGLGRLVALVAAEDEVDRRQHPMLLEQIDDLEPRRREQPPPGLRGAPACPAALRVVRRFLVEAGRVVVRPAVDQRRQQVQAIVRLVADQVQVVELHRAAVLDDRRGRPAHRGDPLGQLGGVADRRRQAHQPHARRAGG